MEIFTNGNLNAFLKGEEENKPKTKVYTEDFMIKAKVFRVEDSSLENELNQWLSDKSIEIIKVCQISKGGNLIVFTIIYKNLVDLH